MTQPDIIVYRSLIAADPDWYEPVVRALETSSPLKPAPSMSPGTARLAKFLTQHSGSDPRYKPLEPLSVHSPARPGTPDRLLSTHDVDLHVGFAQFDYGDEVHGHITSWPGVVDVSFPIRQRRNPMSFKTTSRTSEEPGFDNICYPDDAMIADYIFRRSNIIGVTDTLRPDLMESATNTVTVTGPDLCDPVWEDGAKTPGTDIVHDSAYSGEGLFAIYHVFEK